MRPWSWSGVSWSTGLDESFAQSLSFCMTSPEVQGEARERRLAGPTSADVDVVLQSTVYQVRQQTSARFCRSLDRPSQRTGSYYVARPRCRAGRPAQGAPWLDGPEDADGTGTRVHWRQLIGEGSTLFLE